jgi:hypothetical protein
MSLLPLFSFVLLTAALSTIYVLSPRFTLTLRPCSAVLFHAPLPLFFLVLLAAALSTTYLLSPRFHRPRNILLNDTFSCPYCLCSACLAHCCRVYNLLSTRLHPPSEHAHLHDTILFHAPTASVFQMSCSMMPSLYNLPSLNSFSRTL